MEKGWDFLSGLRSVGELGGWAAGRPGRWARPGPRGWKLELTKNTGGPGWSGCKEKRKDAGRRLRLGLCGVLGALEAAGSC